MRDAALEGLGRGMLLLGGWTGNGAGRLWLNKRSGRGEVWRRIFHRVLRGIAILALMSNIVPDIRKLVIWVKSAKRTVGLIGEIGIEWLDYFNTMTVGIDTQ